MSNYTETFTAVNGDTTDATALETEFDAIATAIATKLDSDGSGTMTGALNMGSNKATNVTDPTAAQDAATKNYVDTGVVADYETVASDTVATNEQVGATLTVTIPSDWVTYDLEVLATFWVDKFNGTPVGNTAVDSRFRETNLGGTVISSVTEVLGSTEEDWAAMGALFGYQQGETATGSRTVVYTHDADGNGGRFQIATLNCKLLCRRTS